MQCHVHDRRGVEQQEQQRAASEALLAKTCNWNMHILDLKSVE
jgi:hypothetical protein